MQPSLTEFAGSWMLSRHIARYKADRSGPLGGFLDQMNTFPLYPRAVDEQSREINRMACARDAARQFMMLERMRIIREKAQGGDDAAMRRLLDLSGRPWEKKTPTPSGSGE